MAHIQPLKAHTADTPGAAATALALSGSLAIYDVARLKPILIGAINQHPALEVDLSGLELIDTAGAQLLMLAKLHALSLSRTLSFTGHSPAVLELFEQMQLTGFFGDPVATKPYPRSSAQDAA